MGKSFLDIAGEKGGIIKKGVDVVTAVTQPPVGRTLEPIAAERGAPLWRVGKDMRYRPTLAGLDYRSLKLRMWGLRLGLGGEVFGAGMLPWRWELWNGCPRRESASLRRP